MMCSFFYGAIDRAYFTKFTDHPRSLLLRFIDDVIFITDSLELIHEFVNVNLRGLFPKHLLINM
jgi:hypothetical protein